MSQCRNRILTVAPFDLLSTTSQTHISPRPLYSGHQIGVFVSVHRGIFKRTQQVAWHAPNSSIGVTIG